MDAYRKYFERQPPTHVLAAWYMDYKPESDKEGAAKAMAAAENLPDIEE